MGVGGGGGCFCSFKGGEGGLEDSLERPPPLTTPTPCSCREEEKAAGPGDQLESGAKPSALSELIE